MDRSHRSPGESRDPHRRHEHHGGRAVNALHRPEAHHGTDEHHPLDAEIEHARPLGEQLAERRVQERRSVRDPRRKHDDEEAVVHGAVSSAGSGPLRDRRSNRTR